ncbi:MAG: hypothetical protein JKY33_08835 [Bacteroidia bacterium]|nr:hypothetical protein [Bacteroidia bacterium]
MKKGIKILTISALMAFALGISGDAYSQVYFKDGTVNGNGPITFTTNLSFGASSGTLTIQTLNGNQVVVIDSQGNIFTFTASTNLANLGVTPGCRIDFNLTGNGNGNGQVVIQGSIRCN